MCPASTRPKNKCGSACAESVHDPISRYKKCGRACSQWVHDPTPAMRSEIARAAMRLPKQAVSPPRHTLLPPGCTRTAVLSFRAPGLGPDTWWILPQCPPATLNINVGDPDLPAYLWQVRECVRVCVRVCVRACGVRAVSTRSKSPVIRSVQSANQYTINRYNRRRTYHDRAAAGARSHGMCTPSMDATQPGSPKSA